MPTFIKLPMQRHNGSTPSKVVAPSVSLPGMYNAGVASGPYFPSVLKPLPRHPLPHHAARNFILLCPTLSLAVEWLAITGVASVLYLDATVCARRGYGTCFALWDRIRTVFGHDVLRAPEAQSVCGMAKGRCVQVHTGAPNLSLAVALLTSRQAIKICGARFEKKACMLYLEAGDVSHCSTKVDVNAAGEGYGSSLEAAAAMGHTEIVCILLDKGADVNAAGGRYGSSLEAAAQQGHTEIVCMLMEWGAKDMSSSVR
ncbi:hypothetical protein K438DRAFT_1776130 [Mycena galopus ATCC 62051]|nr:hypothetical protein K438DRAFT_1776130 [Mycena galopus ATCC 62051]